jgi:alcohol dehydrogenase, propanol-preferring
MKAMIMDQIGQPLRAVDQPLPKPGAHEVLLQVMSCAVCRTDLHVVDGDLPSPKLPLILGHEIVGIVHQLGSAVEAVKVGDRLGLPWLGRTCMKCQYCLQQRENLCDNPVFTGYTKDGGFAQYTVADARFCLPLPEAVSNEKAAPLLCAGLIGWRALKACGEAQTIGIYGFGAAAHIITQIAVFQGRKVYAFTSAGDISRQDFARSLGASWAGSSLDAAPDQLDAAIIFAPVGSLVPRALSNLKKGGTVVCGGIHMSDIPQFSYSLLWQERSIKSVANLTRADGHEFFAIAVAAGIAVNTVTYNLTQANEALSDVRNGQIHGAAVLIF